MPLNLAQYRDVKDYVEDSDSSDGTSPSTPKKSHQDRAGQNGISAITTAKNQTSPVISPTKPVGPSPIRTLFSRPSKMNLSTSASRDVPAQTVVSPQSPHHQDTSLNSFSSLLKHHHHLHKTASNNTVPRGKSFDVLRMPNNNDSSSHLPISPSFFSSTGSVGRNTSSSEHDDNWPLICARVLPLFNGEGLRQPIEDLNRLVATHLLRVHERHESQHIMEDVTELFETGIRSLDNHLAAMQDAKLVSRLSELWVFFFSTVLPYLEATFLPLTIELDAHIDAFVPSGERITVHDVATKSYRDILILPLHDRLATILSQVPLLLGQQETFSRLLQCISVLRRVQSGDARQKQCDELGNAVLFRRAKGRGDRRGIIGRKGGMERERQGSQDSAFSNGVLGAEVADDDLIV